ncbi:alanine racemase [Mucor ambiguus]|uniref:D-serine dehydratase n=1 Tax=Mucor ambiguus TaxID=91626 RepID=A0A0C9NAC5_9FUNG|nr:alanine racemase [Mucor ambiguus]
MVYQTATPESFLDDYRTQMKAKLVKEMVGKKLDQLRTPSLVINKSILQKNCQKLSKIATGLKSTRIRVHVKTHKSVEGARIQLENAQTDAIVVSTLPEAYAMVNSDLTSSGLLKQVLVGFPITADKFDDIFDLSSKVDVFQIFIDNLATLEALEEYCKSSGSQKKINAFLKVDCGYGRAGVPINDEKTLSLAKRLSDSPHVAFTGIYTHAGHSYSSQSSDEALEYLKNECDVARQFKDYFVSNGIPISYVSIGATPTVKAITAFMDRLDMDYILRDIDEVHAGAFAFLDRQQVATGLGSYHDVAISVACRIASVYEERKSVLIDGGALAFSKDTAPQGGFGYVIDPAVKDDVEILASLTKVSQEHGILQHLDETTLSRPELRIGKLVRVIPNHCCLAAACHLYYLVVEDDSDVVVDVWVPVRGW